MACHNNGEKIEIGLGTNVEPTWISAAVSRFFVNAVVPQLAQYSCDLWTHDTYPHHRA